MRAIDDRPRKLRIDTRLSERGDILVSVEDTGAGIDPRQIDRVFDPYFTTKSDGLGLGLTLCRATVSAHGGRLWATHNRPHGTIFHFAIPPSAPEQVDSPAVPARADLPVARE